MLMTVCLSFHEEKNKVEKVTHSSIQSANCYSFAGNASPSTTSLAIGQERLTLLECAAGTDCARL